MQGTVLSNSIVFTGILDEETKIESINSLIEELKKTGITEPLQVDLSSVTRANSMGIVTWLKFVRNSNIRIKYVNCPTWLIFQFNMVTGFFGKDSFVESLQVPFYCEEINANKNFTLTMGKDVPVQENYTGFKLPEKTFDGKKYDADVDPARYFHFVTKIKDNFTQK